MISKNEAIIKYLEKYPERLVDEVFETHDRWIISGKDKVTGDELDVSPESIKKEDGSMEEYFPPMHSASMKASDS